MSHAYNLKIVWTTFVNRVGNKDNECFNELNVTARCVCTLYFSFKLANLFSLKFELVEFRDWDYGLSKRSL